MTTTGRDAAFWAAFCTGTGILLYEADQHGWPLCGVVRRTFRTHTTAGRLALTGSLYVGTEVLRRHLLNPRASLG